MVQIQGLSITLTSEVDERQPPLMFSSAPDHVLRDIGSFICTWSEMESQVNDFIVCLMKVNKQYESGWNKVGFKKRFSIFETQGLEAFQDYPDLLIFHKETCSDIRSIKSLRDYFAHRTMIIHMGQKANDCYIQFKRDDRIRQNSKKYRFSEINNATNLAAKCAGRIYWLRIDEDTLPFSSESIQFLRSLPNQEIPLAASKRALSRQPQS